MFNDIFIRYNYMLPMLFALLIGAYLIIDSMPRKQTKKTVAIDNLIEPFDSKWANELYEMSFKSPFVSFIPEDPNSKQARQVDVMITQAHLSRHLNFRVLGVLQIVLFILAVVFTVVFGFVVQNSAGLIKFLFNFDIAPESQTSVFMIIGLIMMCLALMPKMYIKSKASKNQASFIQELPVLQKFIVSMMKSKRSIGEIYNVLGSTEMQYKDIFRMANNIYIRDRDAAADYLAMAFSGTPFFETITTLKTFDTFGVEDSIVALERRLDSIIDEVAGMKKSKGVLAGLITEGSIMMPFAAVLMLGVAPIGWWALKMVNEAMTAF